MTDQSFEDYLRIAPKPAAGRARRRRLDQMATSTHSCWGRAAGCSVTTAASDQYVEARLSPPQGSGRTTLGLAPPSSCGGDSQLRQVTDRVTHSAWGPASSDVLRVRSNGVSQKLLSGRRRTSWSRDPQGYCPVPVCLDGHDFSFVTTSCGQRARHAAGHHGAHDNRIGARSLAQYIGAGAPGAAGGRYPKITRSCGDRLPRQVKLWYDIRTPNVYVNEGFVPPRRPGRCACIPCRGPSAYRDGRAGHGLVPGLRARARPLRGPLKLTRYRVSHAPRLILDFAT